MKGRVILHSDLNSFYASVECLHRPDLVGKPVAVCGSREERHGIVLTKNQQAKAAGIRTGEVINAALAKCPDLVILQPHYESYVQYSEQVRSIYARYTDLVEPFGIDECWLDVSGSTRLFGPGAAIADEIRCAVRRETGLTVSVGVSYTKTFAKVGSDLKKPDAVTVLERRHLRDRIWPLPVEVLLGVGSATLARLHRYSIRTVGDLANTNPDYLRTWFGKIGPQLFCVANGMDDSPVVPSAYAAPIQSVGHGVTTSEDLMNTEEVLLVMLELARDVGYRLRAASMCAAGVAVTVRDSSLSVREYQQALPHSTRSTRIIYENAASVFCRNYGWALPVRSVTVRAIRLLPYGSPRILSLFDDPEREEKWERIDDTQDALRDRFGTYSLCPAAHYAALKMKQHLTADETPHTMFL